MILAVSQGTINCAILGSRIREVETLRVNGRKWEEMGGNGRAREGEREGERKVLLLLAK